MPKCLPASIVIDLNPTATVGPLALLQDPMGRWIATGTLAE